MDSPQHIGDTTTNSIASQLYGTHINKTPTERSRDPTIIRPLLPAASVSSAVYSGQKFIQICVDLAAVKTTKPNGRADKNGTQTKVTVLRRVQDSYVNVSQMLEILVVLGFYTPDKVHAFLRNEIVSNTQYLPESAGNSLPLFNDFSMHEVRQIRGLWIPFDKAISLAVKFDIYQLIKRLFLVDVHDFDRLPKSDFFSGPALEDSGFVVPLSPSKRPLSTFTGNSEADAKSKTAENADSEAYPESPIKRRKTAGPGTPLLMDAFSQATRPILKKLIAENTNYPYTLPPLVPDEAHRDLVADAKLSFHEIFKSEDRDTLSQNDVETRFKTIFERCKSQNILPSSILDVSLDHQGKTALHYAATLACDQLAQALIDLKICSPVRGDNKGESPLAATLQVTNAMSKGNFSTMLDAWLWPDLWLLDNKNQSFFHYLVDIAPKNYKNSKFYLDKIVEWVMGSAEKKQHLDTLCNKIVNAQESKSGNTALHAAGENGLKWHIYILLELDADPFLSNSMGVKPSSFDCVNHVMAARKAFMNNPVSPATTASLLEALDIDGENDEYLISLVHTGMEFWRKSLPFPAIAEAEDEIVSSTLVSAGQSKELTPTSEVSSSSLLSNKIFKSIQDLLANTNEEYERVIHAKKAEINLLNKELRDATIITANNRLIAKNIYSKMSQVDTMKLQMMNINEKLQMVKKDLGSLGDEETLNADWESDSVALEKYDADEPFIIRGIYDKLVNGEDAEPTQELVDSLPPVDVLRARLRAYDEVNSNLEMELGNLTDYGNLTAQFKKVVSSCTGVEINEVDELLDGLLEAVEGQQ